MSLITAEKFLERLEHESSLKSQLITTGTYDVGELARFAHGKGFVISEEELLEALKKRNSRLVVVEQQYHISRIVGTFN